jgi:hypothetical protein
VGRNRKFPPLHSKFLLIVEYLRARGNFRGNTPPTFSSWANNARGGVYPIHGKKLAPPSSIIHVNH